MRANSTTSIDPTRPDPTRPRAMRAMPAMPDRMPERIMPVPHHERPRSRRDFLARGGAGFGALALLDLLARGASADEPDDRRAVISPLRPKPTHFPATAKSVIFLFMEGGPGHIDLF